MADVFISYARTDKPRVAPLVAAIKAQGWSVWWDPAISAGQQFDDQIEQELQAASAVVVIWTTASVTSRWGRAGPACARSLPPPSTSGRRIRRARLSRTCCVRCRA